MVYIHAVALDCALGARPQDILANLGKNEAPGFTPDSHWLLSGEPLAFGHMTGDLPAVPENLAKHQSRNNRALMSVFNSEPRFRELLDRSDPSRVGIILGTSTSGSEEFAGYIRGFRKGEPDPDFRGEAQELGDPSEFLSAWLSTTGPAYTVSTACTSSIRAIISGVRLLEAGMIDAAIVGGADTLAKLPINGFDALQALSHTRCLPFSGIRDGIAIGEAAALLWLSREPGPIAVRGFGESSDAHHMSAPDPEGEGAEAAIREALQMAGVTPDAIDYLNLHGTGTKLNDSMEAKDVYRVFGDRVTASSTKNLTGHTLGAAGAAEAALIAILLQNPGSVLPPQLPDSVPADPALPPISLVSRFTAVSGSLMMSCNFAFGGSNAALILGTD